MGCDAIQLLWLPNSLNFNPHTHRGVRLLTSWSTFSFVTVFQSTHPSWGATLHCKEVIPLVFSISIHAPIVGCDVVCNKADITLTIISIHAPIVGCDNEEIADVLIVIISIHAPIVGCDHSLMVNCIIISQFQSTHPSWGATQTPTNSFIIPYISIHAPIVGCDASW